MNRVSWVRCRAGLVLLVCVLALSVPVLPGDVQGEELAGVVMPDQVHVDGEKLVLNGAGIRRKFFIKVYVGALYLPAPTREPAHVTDLTGARRVLMHFLYRKVDARKINEAWEEGFRANLTPDELADLMPRLERFKSFFPDMYEGDHLEFDFVPGAGVTVFINGRRAGVIEGDDFSRALLLVWLGEKPADEGLKKGMLGLAP